MKEDLLKLSKMFKELYDKGVLGVSDYHIHVKPDLFNKLSIDQDVQVDKSRTNGVELFMNLSINGEFIKIVTLL